MRAQDPDRYLSTLFAPADLRDALFALYAFDHEIAKARRVVREPMAGLIRLQWWRDALDGIDRGEVLAHPVVQGLGRAIADHGLDRGHLDEAILAREREFEEGPPADLPAFERHLTRANGSVVRSALALLGGDEPGLLAAADRLGVSLGLLEALRRLGGLWEGEQRGEGEQREGQPLWLPAAWLADHGFQVIEQGQADQREPVDAIREVLAAQALRHLGDLRKDSQKIARRLLPAFFPGTLAEVHLRDGARSEQRLAVAAAPFRLLWCWLCGRF